MRTSEIFVKNWHEQLFKVVLLRSVLENSQKITRVVGNFSDELFSTVTKKKPADFHVGLFQNGCFPKGFIAFQMRFEHRFRSFTAVDTHQGNDYHTYKETTREQQFTTVRADKYFIRRVLLFVIVVIIIIIIFCETLRTKSVSLINCPANFYLFNVTNRSARKKPHLFQI